MPSLVSLNTPDPVQCASGQYNEIRCRFLYSHSVIGKEIVFSPGLWFDNPVQLINTTAPTNNIFKATYPASGDIDMTWIGNTILENWHAKIEYVDAFTFDVILKFIATTDLDRFVHQSPAITNNARFTAESLFLSSVYNHDKHAIFSLWIIDDPNVNAQINFPYQQCNYFDDTLPVTFSLKVNNAPVSGFIVGQDLDITIHINASGDPIIIGSDYYIGIIRETPEGSGNLVDAHDLGYAQVNGIVPVVVDDLDNPFISSTPILLTSGLGIDNQYECDVTIETEYFNPDYCYRVYIIYSVNGNWYSAKSDQICNAGAPNVPNYGTITPSITYGEDEFNVGCVTNVAPGTTLTLCAEMNQTEYNTNAMTNGVPGTYATNLQVINVYDSVENLQPGQSLEEITGLTFLGQSADGCYDITIPEAWSGTQRYIIFEYVFFINDDIQYTDYIYWAIPLSVIDIEAASQLSVVITDSEDAEFTNGIICLDYDDIIKATITHADGANYILSYTDPNGIVLTAAEDFQPSGDALITIDSNQLLLDVDRCIKIIATPVSITETDCDCFDIELILSVVSTENGISDVQLGWSVIDPPATFQSIIIKQGTNPAQEFTDQSGNVLYQVLTFESTITMNFLIIVTLENGCSYTTAATIQVFNVEGESHTLTYDICEDAPDGMLNCNNYPRIQYETCFLDDGELVTNVTFDDSMIASTIATDVREYSIDGGVSWLPFVVNPLPSPVPTPPTPPTLVRWTVTYTDDCVGHQVFIPLLCARTPPDCNNHPKIACHFDPDTETFSVTTAMNPSGSNVTDWHLEYSDDGGLTFNPYTVPFVVDDAIDSIIVIANPEYDDSCPQGPVLTCQWVRDEAEINCDYSDYELTSEYDPNTGAHIPTFTGDEDVLEVNTKEYSLDGGVTWTEYLTNPSGELVIFRWTIKFEGCCEKILPSASVRPGASATMMRIVEQVNISDLGAPQAAFVLPIPPGFELIHEDMISAMFNGNDLLYNIGTFGWTVNLGTATVTHANAFDPAEFPWDDPDPDSATWLVYEYWVRTI